MRRSRRISEEEAALWRSVIRTVRPLPGVATLPQDVDPAAAAGQVLEPPSPRESVPGSPTQAVARPVPRPPLPPGVAPGLDRRTEEKLRKGDLIIDGRIDLHGLTQDSAHLALRRFVLAAAESGQRCLLVITGKGGFEGKGVLRREVPRWLEQLRPLVLRVVPAQPRHGGDGAYYLLLKRRR